MTPKSTTTHTTKLFACPVCKSDIEVTISFDLDFEQARAEGDNRPLDVASFVAHAKATGVRIKHDCTPSKSLATGGFVTPSNSINVNVVPPADPTSLVQRVARTLDSQRNRP